jgi:drug/metabolite transporter (DMT)-like permease
MTTISRAITLRLTAGFLFVVMAAIVRHLSAILPMGEVVFARSLIALCALLTVFGFQGSLREVMTTSRLSAHLLRGAVGFAAMALNFIALRFLPVAEAQALNYLTPLFVTLISWLALREKVGSIRCISILIGFAGAVLIASPTVAVPHSAPLVGVVGVAFAVAGAFLMAVAMLQIAKLAKTESTSTIAVYFTLFGSIFSITSFDNDWTIPGGGAGAALLALGLLGALSHVCMTAALGMATPATLAPFEYINVVWALLLGLAAFGEYPTSTSLFGITLIIGAALLVAPTPPVSSNRLRRKSKNS